MDSTKIQEIAFQIILNSGEARTLVHEGFKAMREEDFIEARTKLEQANDSLVKAHSIQTHLLHEYANGVEIKIEVIMVHAQDHLMTTMTLREVALEMMILYQKLEKER
ncbi:PTS cellobiose transporter subunit IIA [Amphibacillus jilinensis]|uniref:PTS cellobiose transporter subunit IIA n=1 Tax=Amphibacillus jilinensis TaxID=1216008 RepID=UPI0003004AA5|nr:PTS cellobiose transporter subunit IIA [Amphibacillus jilinensis]